ncbi:MAG: transcription-repair coupling factor, partial [Dehalococcoidia bacterium]
GGIIDVYSPVEEYPVRLELFGNEVESLRVFDPKDQRSIRSVESVSIIPTTEALAEDTGGVGVSEVIEGLDISNCSPEAKGRLEEELERFAAGARFEGRECYAHLFRRGTLFEYLSQEAVLVVDDPRSLENFHRELDDQAQQVREKQTKDGELPRGFPIPYLSWYQISEKIDSFHTVVAFERWERENVSSPELARFGPLRNYGGHLKVFLRELREMLKEGHRVAIVSHQASRLSELLQEVDMIAPVVSEISKPPPSGSLALVQGALAEGWRLAGVEGASLLLFTDKEIFGFTKQRRAVRKRPVKREAFASELSLGDYVVHVDHGIGRFTGVTTMVRAEGEREYLTLEYADDSKLYVPNDQMDRVTPYIAPGDRAPALSRLGTQEWTRAKRRVKESAEAVARELLALYAKREVRQGYAFGPDTAWQQELEASFPYVETGDQLETIGAVKADMERPRPMDRLVCGDVGYGKTEVAVRAAFKSIMIGKQVAVLVPTTVLAQQHLHTVRERLDAFPVRVEVLSRFRSLREQRQVIEGLKSGAVDICIGTHRLLQKDVEFKDLGLVVIDEEQRFGVTHKERLKKMREEVDVLTLSATPIPRTLHMSLVGVRDMSTMETPPEERLPIKTYVQEYDSEVVREAILKEMDRGGQVFFVHNRVQNIESVAERLRRRVPRAEIAAAHGQMPEHQLESVMVEFVQGQYDVLVCTTIIESGLDMPNVNTIIINEADKMGLSQLYQLRGRVGRGTDRAYAYFLFHRYQVLSDVAEKRLTAILAASELGAGFRIAMKDLEIRGAGNLLGVEQSGHIAAVGFDLYTAMLARAVEELKARGPEGLQPSDGRALALRRLPTTSIDIPIPAYIPEDYVPDLELRLSLYQRMASIKSERDVKEIGAELEDRFGEHPPEVQNLLYLVRIKSLAARRGITRVGREGGQIVVALGLEAELDRAGLASLGPSVRVGTKQVRLHLSQLGNRWQKVLEEVIKGIGDGAQRGERGAKPEVVSPGAAGT